MHLSTQASNCTNRVMDDDLIGQCCNSKFTSVFASSNFQLSSFLSPLVPFQFMIGFESLEKCKNRPHFPQGNFRRHKASICEVPLENLGTNWLRSWFLQFLSFVAWPQVKNENSSLMHLDKLYKSYQITISWKIHQMTFTSFESLIKRFVCFNDPFHRLFRNYWCCAAASIIVLRK